MSIEKVYISKNLEELLDIMNREDVDIISGGTDILVKIRNKKIEPKTIVDISKVKELRYIEKNNEYIEIGSTTTFTDIVNSKIFDDGLFGFKKACKLVGSPQIRNRGTIGGNIINGSSAADSVPPLLCLDAILVYESKGKKREVLLEDFYLDKENCNINKNELLTKIKIKILKGKLSFSKLGLRKALAISRISNSIFLELDKNKIANIKIASGALGLYPLRERKVEEFLLGKELSEATKEEAFNILLDSMKERLEGRSTFPYKKIAVEHTFKEAFEEVIL